MILKSLDQIDEIQNKNLAHILFDLNNLKKLQPKLRLIPQEANGICYLVPGRKKKSNVKNLGNYSHF